MGEIEEIMKALNSSEFKVLFENKLIDEIGVRNFLIRREVSLAKERDEQAAVKYRIAERENIDMDSIKKILTKPYCRKSVFHSFAELEKKIKE